MHRERKQSTQIFLRQWLFTLGWSWLTNAGAGQESALQRDPRWTDGHWIKVVSAPSATLRSSSKDKDYRLIFYADKRLFCIPHTFTKRVIQLATLAPSCPPETCLSRLHDFCMQDNPWIKESMNPGACCIIGGCSWPSAPALPHFAPHNPLAMTRSKICAQAKDNDLQGRYQKLQLLEPGLGLSPLACRYSWWWTSQSKPALPVGSWERDIQRVKKEAGLAAGEWGQLGQDHRKSLVSRDALVLRVAYGPHGEEHATVLLGVREAAAKMISGTPHSPRAL